MSGGGHFPFQGHIRLVIRPTVNDLAAPTLAEITGGTEVTADLTAEGLTTQRETRTVDRTPWRGRQAVEAPDRWTTRGTIRGYRFQPDFSEVLWDLAGSFGQEAVAVARHGVPSDQPWQVGDRVETLRFRWGKRTLLPPTRNTATIFEVPLLVIEDHDDAVVA